MGGIRKGYWVSFSYFTCSDGHVIRYGLADGSVVNAYCAEIEPGVSVSGIDLFSRHGVDQAYARIPPDWISMKLDRKTAMRVWKGVQSRATDWYECFTPTSANLQRDTILFTSSDGCLWSAILGFEGRIEAVTITHSLGTYVSVKAHELTVTSRAKMRERVMKLVEDTIIWKG